MRIRLLLAALLLGNVLLAQPYSGGKKTRQRFAQTTFGLDLYHLRGNNVQYLYNDTSIRSVGLNNNVIPRIHIGGLHFWGHAEFYFNINLPELRWNNDHSIKVKNTQGDIFGVKIFPKAVNFKRINFYAGTSFAASKFSWSNNGDKASVLSKINLPFSAGLFYYRKKWAIDLSFTYLFNKPNEYYFSKTGSANVNGASYLFNFGIRKLFETTVSAEKNYLNGKTDSVYKELKQRKKLSSLFFGGGPSSSFYLKENENNQNTFAFMGNQLASVFPELVAGYYYQPFRMHTALVLRHNVANKSAFDVSQKFKRTALGVESHFLLFDYNGFVPYAGAHLSYETLSYQENNAGKKLSYSQNAIKAGIVCGWDILPDKLQYFTLRTNIRYFPNLIVPIYDNKKVLLDQIEFNFIEFVYYPQRKKNIRY